jgi:hypothetical protein
MPGHKGMKKKNGMKKGMNKKAKSMKMKKKKRGNYGY